MSSESFILITLTQNELLNISHLKPIFEYGKIVLRHILRSKLYIYTRSCKFGFATEIKTCLVIRGPQCIADVSIYLLDSTYFLFYSLFPHRKQKSVPFCYFFVVNLLKQIEKYEFNAYRLIDKWDSHKLAFSS